MYWKKVFYVTVAVTITLEFLSPQYKVLSVLPGSGMGISVATPSTQKVVKSSQIDLYCTFHNTQCFKAALPKNHDDNVYNIFMPYSGI